MRRLCAITLSCLIVATILLGCSRPNNAKDDKQLVVNPNVKLDEKKNDGQDNKKETGEQKNSAPLAPLVEAAQLEKEQKFKDAVNKAMLATLDNNRAEALAGFELALTIKDDDFVRDQIAELKKRAEQEGTAKSAVKNIEIVINEGKADEAVVLVNNALKAFGDGDEADKLVQLKLQADALQAVQSNEKNDERFKRFRKEGDAAKDEKKLRAAALAYEQALQAQKDDNVQAAYDEIRVSLDKYDSLRKKAAELRRDPAQLEDALEALMQAKEAWATVQLDNDIDELKAALRGRRDTVSVADFEVSNDLGIPDAGAAFADDILPLLEVKYGRVDRGQLKRVLAELKLEQGPIDDGQQQQIGKLAKVRYLVFGSIRQIDGVIVQARLVDVRTGLVVQTAKIVAPTVREALDHAPDLAKQLLMSDDEKMQFDLEVQQKAANKVEVVGADEAIKPAPLPPGPDVVVAPPKMRILNPAPPQFGDLEPKAFANLAPPPAQVVAAPANLPREQVRQRVLFASVEMGDELFRAGRFREAQRHFEFALNLAPNNFDIRIRLDNLRPHLPPPAVIVVGQPVIVARPRIAVLPFVTAGHPRVVPHSLRYWTPENLTPYFASRFDVVDPAEIYWLMGRMGMTMRDLMHDPEARRWLGRAAGVRYFVVGSHIETASFDVNAYLLDAEFGYMAGHGQIHVRNTYELKLRLPELAALTMMTPAERTVYFEAKRQQEFELLVISGRRHLNERRYAPAVVDLQRAAQLRPGVIIVQMDLAIAQDALRLEVAQAERRRQYEAQLAMQQAQRARQLQLAQEAEAARRRAIAQAAARSEADTKVHINFRFQAQTNMIKQAQVAVQTKNFGISVNLFQGAMNMAPPPAVVTPQQQAVYQDFAQARLDAERAAHLRDAQFAAAREAALQKKRQQDLANAQQAIAAEHARQKQAEDAARAAVLARDKSVYDAAMAQGNNLASKGKYEAAIVAFQGAQRVAHGPAQRKAVDDELQSAVGKQAEELAKSETERQQLQVKLAAEKARRIAAEKQAKQNEELYKDAMRLAEEALKKKNYPIARAKYEEAGKLLRSDAYLSGIRQVDEAQAAEQARANAEAKKAERIKQLVADGNAAVVGQDYDKAALIFGQAKKLAPNDLTVMTGLTRAEQLRDQRAAEVRRAAETSANEKNFQRLLKSAQENLKNKQYEAAVAILAEARKLNPTDPAALAAEKDAKAGYNAAITDAKAKAAAQARAETYQKHINAGQFALTAKRYDDAIKAFDEAQKVLPGDKASKDFLQEARSAKKAAEDMIASAAKQRAEEAQKAAAVQKLLTQGRTALAAKDLATAAKLFEQAKALIPKDAEVQRSLKDLDAALQRQATEAAALKKRDADFKMYFDTGKEALEKKQYAQALKALSNATTLIPENKAAQDLFRRAQTEQRQAEEAIAAGKQKQADYQANLNAGAKALNAKNYDEAIKAFERALTLMPKDLQATKLLAQAQQEAKVLSSYRAAMDAGEKSFKAKMYPEAVTAFNDALKWIPKEPQALKRLAEATAERDKAGAAAKTQASFNAAMVAGQKALSAKNFGAAYKEFDDALKLIPNDPRALQLRQEAQQGYVAENYTKAMTSGQLLQKNMKYPEAIKSFNEALKWLPKDPAALQQIQQTEKLWQNAKKMQEEEARLDKDRKLFAGFMKQGDGAMAVKNFDGAAKAYQSALKIMPKDVQANLGLQAALKGIDASKMKTPPPPNPFDQAMQRGAALEKEQKYGEAMKAFQDALKFRQKDPDAIAGMKRNQFYNHIVVGQKYLDGGMFIDAQREFEAALRIQNDKNVQALLEKAKKKMK